MMFKNFKNKGFTLIELLAVIIILGVLMIIAVPAVTKYIEDSRKSGYVSTAKELAGGARTLIHSGNLNLTDKDTTYYIDSKCIESSNGAKTPYGELTKAYVVVNYSDDGYDYYWTSVDDAGVGVKKITNLEKLDTDSIETNIAETDILNNLGVDARHNYVVINEEIGCSLGTVEEAPTRVDTEGNVDVVDYPVGKTNKALVLGDIVKIGDQEFFFLKYDGDDKVLIARYNLKVGYATTYANNSEVILDTYTPSDPGYGLQNSECIGSSGVGSEIEYCVDSFSETDYWNGQLGAGKKYPDNHVYDENSNIYQYVEDYKSYLEGLGANIKEARLITGEDYSSSMDVRDLYRNNVYSTTFWTGYVYENYGRYYYIGFIMRVGAHGMAPYNFRSGVRPVIVI